MSQQAEIKHRHCMTYNKLKSDVNSAKQLLLSHHHHHKSSLSSTSSICYLSPLDWPPTVGQKTVPMFGCFAKIEVEQIKKIR